MRPWKLKLTLVVLSQAFGCSAPQLPYLLDSHPTVEFGTKIDPASEVWTLGDDSVLYRSGSKTTLSEAQALPREKGTHPILIEVSSGRTVKECIPLLIALIGSNRTNISFLVSATSGHRRVVLPIPKATFRLAYIVGAIEYGDSKEDTKRLFLMARVDPSGGCRVNSLAHCSYSDLDAIEFPEVKEGTREVTPPSRHAKPAPWQGRHPPLGTWTAGVFREFMVSPEIRSLSPAVILEVEPGDQIQDFLRCLDTLHQVAFGKTVVQIPQPR